MEEALLEMFVAGTSQEKAGQIAKTLTGVALSDSAVSRLTRSLEADFQAWRVRPLADYYQIVYLDGLYFPIRYETHSSQMAVNAALGITGDGHKEVLALTTSAGEYQAGWSELLRDLQKRGVSKVALIVSAGSLGIIAAIKEVFPFSLRQRCLVHKQRDILSHLPSTERAEISPYLSGIWHAQDLASARTELAAFKVRYQTRYPEAIRSLEDDLEQCLSFYQLETKWWKFARTMMYPKVNTEKGRK